MNQNVRILCVGSCVAQPEARGPLLRLHVAKMLTVQLKHSQVFSSAGTDRNVSLSFKKKRSSELRAHSPSSNTQSFTRSQI